MLWMVLRRTLLLISCMLLLIAIPVGMMLLEDWRFARSFTSAHQGAAGEPVTYQHALFFFSPTWQGGLLISGAMLGLCLLIALLWSLSTRRNP